MVCHLLEIFDCSQPSSNNEVSEGISDDEQSDEIDDEQRSLMDQFDERGIRIENSKSVVVPTDFYTLDEKVELGEMSTIFFSSSGAMAVYLCLAVYLFGDLSIYCAALSTTLRDVICDRNTTNANVLINETILRNEPCWNGYDPTRFDIYRLCLMFFFVLMSPWVFFNVSKTKYLQFTTLSFRWLSFAIMIYIACYRIVFPPDGEIMPTPPKANIHAIPFLIGSSIYAFMSQHSMPSILVPIKEKHKIARILSLDYFLIAALYLILAMTGIFAFSKLEDLYTLNFIPKSNSGPILVEGIDYFLSLYPILTLTSSFPLVAITLRNNLQTLFVEKHHFETRNIFVRRIIFPLAAVIPPFIITFNTENVQSLVSYTGCYGGAVIQYVIPVALVYYSRRTCKNILGEGIVNEFRSRFQSILWLIMLLTWTCVSLILVSINMFK